MAFLQKYIFPPLIALFYWLWSHTWRFKVIESPQFTNALQSGPLAFAHYHGDNLVVLRLGRQYRCASLASMSSDGELITRVLVLFGFGIARGSSRRGGVRALVGLMSRVKEGYNPAIAVDGPKGPPFKVKPGIVYVAKHAKIPIVPTGVAFSSALVFNKAWDKTRFPWPFSKVVVSFGAPISDVEKDDDALVSETEARLAQERVFAEQKLGD